MGIFSVKEVIMTELFGQAWGKVDWRKTDYEIGVELELETRVVYEYRRNHFPHTIDRRKKHDWTKVDWGKTTTEIANEMGVSLTAVTHHRKKEGKGVGIREGGSKYKWEDVDWSLPNAEIVKMYGIPYGSVVNKRWSLSMMEKEKGENND